jgi:hypothetical protein
LVIAAGRLGGGALPCEHGCAAEDASLDLSARGRRRRREVVELRREAEQVRVLVGREQDDEALVADVPA